MKNPRTRTHKAQPCNPRYRYARCPSFRNPPSLFLGLG